jgi:death-on-curing protein
MNYLTAEQVVFIHAFVVDETGGSHGVRDLGLLESAVARPQATFGGEDLHPDLFLKAAALLHALIQNHPFVDGNKRTGALAVILFLELNGYSLIAKNKELESFALRVALSKIGLSEIADWLRKKSEG